MLSTRPGAPLETRASSTDERDGAPLLRPRALPRGAPRKTFTRGREHPRGVVWFGARSFWGHLRHFVASAIATEDVDSRDWMTPDPPAELLARIAEILGADPSRATLVEALDRDVWVDYLSDTGDDVAVSRAVARLVFAPYELPDPDVPGAFVQAPRGDILIFGGDTAYPVATAKEITNRVLVPFNQVLEQVDDGKRRVLMGIPGNHDWYDGLDGFARMFRRRTDDEDDEHRPSVVGISSRMLEHYAEWAREFVRGGHVEKPRALILSGYVPVQNASYFALPLTPNIHVYGVDRQLRSLDRRQRRFFFELGEAHPEINHWVLLPDPVYRFGAPSRTGTAMVRALGLDFDARAHFMLSGDVHHYQRVEIDRTLHVTAGGGGAFLHPTHITRKGKLEPTVEWPDAAQCRALLGQVPWKIARGRSGFLPHLVFALLFLPAMNIGVRLYDKLGLILSAPIAITLVTTTIYALIGGVRRRPRQVLPLAFAAGALTALIPVLASLGLTRLFQRFDLTPSLWSIATLTFLIAIFAGAFVFGAYLALLTRLGLEHTQAFTALDHPGFKHFLRLRVRRDGRGIDMWCIGLVDPLAKDAEPVLVDHVAWRPESTP